MHGGFVVVCPTKSVALGGDGALHREDHTAELHAELEFSHKDIASDEYAYLPGGGLRAINPSRSMTLTETPNCIAVFKG